MSKRSSGWDQNLSVTAHGKGLVGHAGAVLLRKCADRVGLTTALSGVLPLGRGPGWWDRGQVLVNLAVSIVLGGRGMSDIALLAHQRQVFGDPPSDSTAGRSLAMLDDRLLRRIAAVRARIRRHVWHLLTLRPSGFPWLNVAGKLLVGWIVIDIDATLIGAHSAKADAAVTFKKGFGFHPLGAWCANTSESLAMLLRPGNAGSNTVADHLRVLTDAIGQLPPARRTKLLIRVDGAGATHDLLRHLEALNTACRSVYYTTGWMITNADEAAIAALPAHAWDAGLHQDGQIQPEVGVAELTGLSTRTGWPTTQRLIVRRTRPAGRHRAKLTPLEHATGWRYTIVATNINRIPSIAGSHQPQWLDVLHRAHAAVEDRVRTNKAMGLHRLPSHDWTVNRGWVLTANLACDLNAWTRLLGLHDQPDLAHAEPDTLRYRLWHLPARLTSHARQRRLAIPNTWPRRDAFTTCWQRLSQLPLPT